MSFIIEALYRQMLGTQRGEAADGSLRGVSPSPTVLSSHLTAVSPGWVLNSGCLFLPDGVTRCRTNNRQGRVECRYVRHGGYSTSQNEWTLFPKALVLTSSKDMKFRGRVFKDGVGGPHDTQEYGREKQLKSRLEVKEV